MNLTSLLQQGLKFLLSFLGNSALPRQLGGAKTITIDSLPSDVESFIQLRNTLAKTPEGGAALFLVAAIQYTKNPKMGRHFVIISTDKKWLNSSKSEQAYKGFDLGHSADFSLKQLNDKAYIPFSYIKGTHVSNAYHVEKLPYQFSIERSTDAGDGTVKVYVKTNGADSARPVTMKKNEAGFWKCMEYSSLFTSIKTPQEQSKGAAEGDF